MEGNSTRERALAAALELFGRKGYDSVSMNDIAEVVGVRAPSLYKHFESKEALFSAITPMAREHYRELWAQVSAAQSQLERDVHVLGTFRVERLEEETLAWIQPELENGGGLRAFVRQSPECGRWLWDEPLTLYEGFFSRLIDAQAMKRGDAHVMAVEYLAPIFCLFTLADGDPARRGTVIAETRKHVRQFHRVFAVRERPSAPSGGVRGLFRR